MASCIHLWRGLLEECSGKVQHAANHRLLPGTWRIEEQTHEAWERSEQRRAAAAFPPPILTRLCSHSRQNRMAFPTSLRFWKHTVFSSAYSMMSFSWWWKNSRMPGKKTPSPIGWMDVQTPKTSQRCSEDLIFTNFKQKIAFLIFFNVIFLWCTP